MGRAVISDQYKYTGNLQEERLKPKRHIFFRNKWFIFFLIGNNNQVIIITLKPGGSIKFIFLRKMNLNLIYDYLLLYRIKNMASRLKMN